MVFTLELLLWTTGFIDFTTRNQLLKDIFYHLFSIFRDIQALSSFALQQIP